MPKGAIGLGASSRSGKYGLSPAPPTAWEAVAADAGFIDDAFGDAVADIAESVADIAESVGEVFAATLIPIAVEIYVVRRDGRVCPECGPYDGSLWDAGEGPMPPLHPNCRCQRLTHHVEWRTAP